MNNINSYFYIIFIYKTGVLNVQRCKNQIFTCCIQQISTGSFVNFHSFFLSYINPLLAYCTWKLFKEYETVYWVTSEELVDGLTREPKGILKLVKVLFKILIPSKEFLGIGKFSLKKTALINLLLLEKSPERPNAPVPSDQELGLV